MANGDKCDNPDIHHPVAGCSKGTGKLVADVITYRESTKKVEQGPLPDVSIKIEGPTNKGNQKSGSADGVTPVVDGLDPGNYKLTLEPTAAQQDAYDFATATTSQTRPVGKDQTQAYHFEVPFRWLEFQVFYPDEKTSATGIEYVVRVKKPVKDAKFEPYPGGSGKTTDSKGVLEKIPAGRYKLDLKLVYDPVWGDKEAVIGQAIDLKAGVSGFDSGTKASLEIYDAQDPSTKLLAVDATVAEDDKGQRTVKASWTPTQDSLKALRSGRVMFCAVVGSSTASSSSIPVFNKQKYEVVDETGKKIHASFELRLSTGVVLEQVAAGGEVDVKCPWNDPVVRIDMPGQRGKQITFEDDGASARSFQIPL
jgi:hypothetical protein